MSDNTSTELNIQQFRKNILNGSEGGLDPGTSVDELMEVSQRDYLTNLLNQRGLFNQVYKTANILKREGRFKNFGVIAGDMIGLKVLNNKLKMSGADEKIKESAEVFRLFASRAEDSVCRWAGDEFVIVSFNTHGEGIKKHIEDIQDNLPDLVKFNFVYTLYREVDPSDLRDKIEQVVDELDAVKKQGPTDETGRSIGNGVVVELKQYA